MNYKKKDKWLYVIILFAVAIVIEAAILIMIWTRRHSGTGASAPAIEEKLRTGQKYLSEMDYDKAIAAFTEAIEVDEKSTE
ncbi:MAG: tetratricopeptide repeat protein, partial [Eubacteriales bacterium]|nr:tetratricopeptide repeat protein [Eubacteriales bacterium]